MTDDFLLSRLAANDRDALAEIAARHAGTVYAAALRQTRNAAMADDVTQAVFLCLCRKATSIRKGTILVGWLYTTTRNIAATARRAAARRNKHERDAAESRASVSSDSSAIDSAESAELLPLLDDAMHVLPSADRDAVLLRYFNNLPFATVGERLGTTEEGARKRVTRAIDKIRTTFSRRGLATTSMAVTALLAAEGAKAAPAAVVAGAIASAGGVSSGGAAALLAASSPIFSGGKLAASLILATALVAATATGIAIAHRPAAEATTSAPATGGGSGGTIQGVVSSQVQGTPPAIPGQPPLDDAWFKPFEAVYALEPGEVVKFIPAPFIPERLKYYRWSNPGQADAIPAGPSYMELEKDLASKRFLRMGFAGPGGGATVREIAIDYCGLAPHEIAGPQGTVVGRTFQGDWVGDHDAPLQAKLDALAAIVSRETGKGWTFKAEEIAREIVVISGAVPKGADQYKEIDLSISNDGFVGQFIGTGPVSHVVERLSSATGWPVVDERKGKGEDNRYVRITDDGNNSKLPFYPEATKSTPPVEMREILDDLGEQLGVTCKIEKRKFTRWVLTGK